MPAGNADVLSLFESGREKFLDRNAGAGAWNARPFSASTYGGLLSFLHHQSSFSFPGLLLGVPLIGKAALLLNAPFSWFLPTLDRVLDPTPLFPLGVIVATRKPDVPSKPQVPGADGVEEA